MQKNHFSEITLLVTHYNRSASLENLLESFRKLEISFNDIIVSDDGSQPVHFERLKVLQSAYKFTLVPAITNGGLGRNLNKGQDAVHTPYTLYVQEDFEATGKFLTALVDAYNFLESDSTLDIARFYAYYPYPYLTSFKNGFSKIDIPLFAANYRKIYAYSDHPHLRRSTFFQKFGRYPEGLKGDLTEYRMCISFIQNKGKGIFFDKHFDLFIQRNSSEEPSTMVRAVWRQKNIFLINVIRGLYRQLKYNFDILFAKPLQ